MDDLEEIVRRNAERAHQRLLDGLRHLVEPGLVVAFFEDVNSGDWHLKSPSFTGFATDPAIPSGSGRMPQLLCACVRSRGLANQQRTALPGQIRPQPLRLDPEPVLKLGERD